MIKILDLVKTTKMSRSTIDNRIKKLGIRKIKIVQGVGGSVGYVSEYDAKLIEESRKPYKWAYHVKALEVAKELGMPSRELVIMAKGCGIEGVKVRRDSPKASACLCYSPEEYEMLVNERKALFSKIKKEKTITNRDVGLYHRVSPYWSLNSHQRSASNERNVS